MVKGGGAVSRAEQENIASGEAEGGAGSRAGETAIAGRVGRALGWSAELRRTAARLLPLFPYAAALLLSESRGAWLAAASAGAAALLWKRQLSALLLLAGAAPVAAAALLYRQLARTGLAAEPLPGLLLLAGLWAGALLAGLWLHRRSCRAAGWHRAAMLALAAVAWTAAASAVLLQVRARITGPSPTAAARGLFYRDAWKLAAEAPWLGRGGETWRHSYLAAQSRPYVGSQVHSGYLDILLNLGTAGLAAVLLLLLAAGWLVFKASPRLLPPLLVIILHSAVDFDWSYGLIWMLLLLLPAWALAETIARPVAEGTAILTRLRRSWPYAGIAVLCALTFMLSILSYQAMRGLLCISRLPVQALILPHKLCCCGNRWRGIQESRRRRPHYHGCFQRSREWTCCRAVCNSPRRCCSALGTCRALSARPRSGRGLVLGPPQPEGRHI